MKFIIAVDDQWGFAKNHQIPWHEPEDFRFFKSMTKNHTCVMGFNTFDELARLRNWPTVTPLLPSRKSLVLTSRTFPLAPDVEIIRHLEDIPNQEDLFVLGGKSLYDHALQVCAEGWVTRISGVYGCDQFFDGETLQAKFDLESVLSDNGRLRFEHWVKKGA
jgi:dihydrofolate reductase